MSDTPSPHPNSGNGSLGREIRLLEQYETELRALKDALADSDPQSAKPIQQQIERKLQIYSKQIAAVQSQWPEAAEGKLHEAAHCTYQAVILVFSSGAMRRMCDRSSNMALKIATGLVAKGQEASNRTKALALLDKALSIADHPYSHYVKACILTDQGQTQNALAELDHIIAHFGDDEDVYMDARKMKDTLENPPKKGCFVATAAYGSPMADEVVLLSQFRDEVLLASRAGRMFVAFYYRMSPSLADFISKFAILRAVTRRVLLSPILWILRFANKASQHTGTP